MVRTVKVGLEADVKGFVEPVDRAGEKLDDLDGKVGGLDRSLGNLPADAAKAGAGLKGVGDAAGLAGDQVDELGDQVDQLDRAIDKIPADAARAAAAMKLLEVDVKDVQTEFHAIGDKSIAMDVLERRISSTRTEVKKLGDEFARTGDIDVFHKLGRASGDLSFLTGLRKRLTDDLAKGGVEAAGTFASAFQGGLMGTFKALPPEAQAALAASLAGVAIAAAPFIVSAINGAILGGIGAGGLAAGIAVQLQDPVVMGAFQKVGDHIQSTLNDSTSSFRAPLLAVAGDLDESFAKIRPNIKGFFEGLAPSISTLGTGLSKSIEILGPALERAAGPASQVLDAIADEIPEIAQQLGTLLDDISEHGDSAAAAIKFILFNVEALITGFDILVRTVGPAADGIVHIGQAMGLIDDKKMDHFLTTLDKTPASADIASGSMETLGTATYNTADAADAANTAFEALFNQFMSLDKANLQVAEDFRTLEADIRKNGISLDEGTASGEKNRKMILGMIGDLEKQREAAIANGNGTKEATDKANAAYLAQLQRLHDNAVAAGLNTTELDKLLAKYKALAAQPDIGKSITLTTIYKTKGDHYGSAFTEGAPVGHGYDRADANAQGGIRRAATGLLVPPSDPGTILMGEPQTGGEALIPLRGIPPARAMSLAQQAVSGYGLDVVQRGGSAAPSPVNVTVRLEASGDADSGLMSAIAHAARIGKLQLRADVDGRVRPG